MDVVNQRFISAALTGSDRQLSQWLEKGADIDFVHADGQTALILTAKFEYLECTKVLLENRCNKEAKDDNGFTALLLAARSGHTEVTKELLSYGCNTEAKSDDGFTSLLYAAQNGHLKIIEMLIDNNCDKEATTDGGATALMLAAVNNHLEVTQLLLDNGFDKDAKDKKERTALMWTVLNDHLKITQLLLDNLCNKDAIDSNGKTALHLAAENVRPEIAECLVFEGCDPLIKTRKGETPFDLASEEHIDEPQITTRSRKKLMDFLKSEMTGDSQRVRTKTSVKTKATRQAKVDEVPTQISLMVDKRSVPLYLKLLESDFEKKRDIRIVVVGKKGAGKTSLINRLFKEVTKEDKSTNGINIHTIKCKGSSIDNTWNKLETSIDHENTERHARLLKAFTEKLQSQHNETTDDVVEAATPKNIRESWESYQNLEIQKESKAVNPVFRPFTAGRKDDLNRILEETHSEIETMLKSEVDLYDKEEYVTLSFWDFAGDEEFYHTHQTFLSQDAIYLVVTKLNEADNKNSQDLFRFWMDSIHCYSEQEKTRESADNMALTNDLDPPVVLIGTWKDDVTCENEKIDDACRENLLRYTKNMSDDNFGHIRGEYFISNTEDDNVVFEQIRQFIVKLARTTKAWNKDYPLKFIELEKKLQEKKKELPIVSYEELKLISTKTLKPLKEDELKLFLEFHHEIRTLVYFKDLPEYIILDTQWLADAFKCVVTAKKFQAISIKNQKQLEELHSKGKLHNGVLEDIFKKEPAILYNHKEHILNVMERFDIIIRPNVSNKDNKPCFYVPCLIKEGPECNIYDMFNLVEGICKRSTWLCFQFRFLPPHLMNHLIAALSRKYEVAHVVDKDQNKSQIALFKDNVVFELQQIEQSRKLFVTACQNMIKIQVWEYVHEIGRRAYKYIAAFVTEEIETIVHERFKMSTVQFKRKWECGLTNPIAGTILRDISKEEIETYVCNTCHTTHKFIDEWSFLPNKVIITDEKYEKKSGQKGLVLIVNFIFDSVKNFSFRQGSDVDVENLKKFFSKLEYEVVCASEDMKTTDLQKCLLNIEKEYLTEKSADFHSFICVIMSHGDENGVFTRDGHITVNEIKEQFKNKPGGKFNGKPKVFLIQACRGKKTQEKVVVHDSLQTQFQTNVESDYGEHGQISASEDQSTDAIVEHIMKLPTDADLIIAYATTQGYISNRCTYYGTYFIRAFLCVAETLYEDKDIEEILRHVRKELASNPEYESRSGKCQMGMLESTSTKKFFL